MYNCFLSQKLRGLQLTKVYKKNKYDFSKKFQRTTVYCFKVKIIIVQLRHTHNNKQRIKILEKLHVKIDFRRLYLGQFLRWKKKSR